MSKSIKIVVMLGLVASASACTYRVGGGGAGFSAGGGAGGGAGMAVRTGAAVATEEFVIVEPGLTRAPVITSKYN